MKHSLRGVRPAGEFAEVVVQRASDESDLSHYVAYWGAGLRQNGVMRWADAMQDGVS